MEIVSQIKNIFVGQKNTIWGKYMKRLLPAVIALIVVLDITIFFVVKQSNYHNTELMAKQSITLQAKAIDKLLKSYAVELMMIRSEYYRNNDTLSFLKTAGDMLYFSKNKWSYVRITFPDGRTYTTKGGLDKMDGKKTKFYKAIMENGAEFHIQRPLKSHYNGDDVWCYSIPVHDMERNIMCILSAVFPTNEIDDMMYNLKANGAGYSSITDVDNVFRIYRDSTITELTLDEMTSQGFTNIDKLVEYGWGHKNSSLYLNGQYKTPEGINVEAYMCFIGETDLVLCLSIPTIQLNASTILIGVLLCIMAVLTIVIIIVIVKKVTSKVVIEPLSAVNSFTTDFSDGKLYSTKANQITSEDEFGILKQNISNMQDRLYNAVSSIRKYTKDIAQGANVLRNSVSKISSDAQIQASAVDDISHSVDIITNAIRVNTNKTIDTKEISDKISEDIQQVTSASMSTLEGISNVISKVEVINEIASRTDLLAINAAVEAARAGENGKGFAVVAAEIRKLAEHCQEASTEINESSAASLDITQKSVELIQQISPRIQENANKMSEISESSSEQLNMTQNISRAVLQLVDITANNNKSAEDLSNYAIKLNELLQYLDVSVEFFKLNIREDIGREHLLQEIETHTSQILKLKSELIDIMEKTHGNYNSEEKRESDDVISKASEAISRAAGLNEQLSVSGSAAKNKNNGHPASSNGHKPGIDLDMSQIDDDYDRF